MKSVTLYIIFVGIISTICIIPTQAVEPQLVINSIITDPLYEGTDFLIIITADGSPVPLTKIIFAETTVYTDMNGRATVTAPQVNQTTDMLLTALKDGYRSAESWIRVVDSGINPQLMITAPAQINEGIFFNVIVSVADTGKFNLSQVTVTFNEIVYFTDNDGFAKVQAPEVDETREFSITAQKRGYRSAQKVITIVDTSIPPNPQLVINAPATVIEEHSFSLIVTADALPIPNVTILFLDTTTSTDENGEVTLTAPTVDETSISNITATKEGYQTASIPITILNQEENSHYGTITGLVTDTEGKNLSNASVRIILSIDEFGTVSSRAVVTDPDGTYELSMIEPGTYTLEAQKEGYDLVSLPNIVISEDTTTVQDITLVPIPTETEESSTAFIETSLQEKITEKTIGARVLISDEQQEITYYNEELQITILSIKGTIAFQVQADNETLPTIVLVQLIDHVLTRVDQLEVRIDNIPITQTTDTDGFFTLTKNSTAEWMPLYTETGRTFILVSIPHFSSHTITFSSDEAAVEAFGITPSLLLYLGVFVLLGLLFYAPIWFIQKR